MGSDFISRLRRQRAVASMGGATHSRVTPHENGPGEIGRTTPALEPPTPGKGAQRPAPKVARGLSGAMLRQTVTDVFKVGDDLGIPGVLLGKFAAGMDPEVGTLRDLARRIHRALDEIPARARPIAAALPARLLTAMHGSMSRLDAATAALNLRQVIEFATHEIECPNPLTRERSEALGIMAHAIGVIGGPEIGAELMRAGREISNCEAPFADVAAARVIDASIARVTSAAGMGALPLFQTVLAACLEAASEPASPLEAIIDRAVASTGAEVNDSQRALVAELATATRELRDSYAQIEKDAEKRLAAAKAHHEQSAQGEHREKIDALAPLTGSLDVRLSREAQILWYEQVSQNLGAEKSVLWGIAAIHLDHLAHRGHTPPPADRPPLDPAPEAGARPPIADAPRGDAEELPVAPEAALRSLEADPVTQITRAILALAEIPGIPQDAFRALAADYVRTHPQDAHAATLTVLTQLLQRIEAPEVLAANPALPAMLARGLAGRAVAFQEAARSEILVSILKASLDDPHARAQAFTHAPRIAEATHAIEPGEHRGVILDCLPGDLGALAQSKVDFATVAATHPSLPEDALLRFIAIGVSRGIELDKWLSTLTSVFKNARSNKEHIRSIRTLIVLADHAGTDLLRLLETLAGARLSPQQFMRTINALLSENNRAFTPEQVIAACEKLQRGENLAESIEKKLQEALVKKLELDKLLQDANIRVTDRGLAIVTGDLNGFFSQGLTNELLDPERNGSLSGVFRDLLIAVLEDRFDAFRFTTPRANAQLELLTPEQRQMWEEGSTMTHVRFDEKGHGEFQRRVRIAAKIAEDLFRRMSAAWGNLAELSWKHTELAEALRNIDKNDLAARAPRVREIRPLPAKIAAMEWAEEIARMTPETTTPIRFAEMAHMISQLRAMLGENGAATLDVLSRTLTIEDLAYSEVVTHDRLDLAAIYRAIAIGTGCLRGWPHKLDFLAYAIDANKRMIMTKNQAKEERRAVMRIVERQDEGHEGEPMLILERAYPDAVTEEEKQRLVEHMLRRATAMGIAAGYATEYYWDSSKTGRRIMDMNAVLEDLNRRYHTSSEIKQIKVLNRVSNMPSEYLDSAPKGMNMRGQVGERYYATKEDTIFENEFLILEPRK